MRRSDQMTNTLLDLDVLAQEAIFELARRVAVLEKRLAELEQGDVEL